LGTPVWAHEEGRDELRWSLPDGRRSVVRPEAEGDTAHRRSRQEESATGQAGRQARVVLTQGSVVRTLLTVLREKTTTEDLEAGV
jgi:hypothetical protein